MMDIATLVTDIALTLSFIIALIFGIAQVKAAGRDRRERLTLRTLNSFQTRDFAELGIFINNTTFPTTREGMLAMPRNEQVMLFQFAQQMESLGMLVAEGLIDIDLVDKTLGSYVTTSWEKYKPLFLGFRDNDPFLGEYFQLLAERIEKRMRECPREPFYKTPPRKNGHK